MRAGAVLDYARTLLGPAGAAIPTAHLLQLLNVAQEEVSREARVPQVVVVYNITAANQLVLPDNARREGLAGVWHVSTDSDGNDQHVRELPIRDFVTASRLHPQWTLWEPSGQPRFVFYDPGHNPDNPRPYPQASPATPQRIRVLYVQRPTALTGPDSVVLDDKLSALMPVLAYRVAYLLTKDGVMLREYERAMNAIHGQRRPPLVPVRNTMYQADAPRGPR